MEVMDRADCVRLLAMRSPAVGRLAVVVDGDPAIFPVNYGMIEDRVVFRSGDGTKLRAAVDADRVAFEIDDASDGGHGWSVVVVGRCVRAPTNGPHLMVLQGTHLEPFAAGDKLTWLMIEPESITGRRVPAVRGWYW
jgi:nitroimidazol reductase NimA-like FMN-containing flavoprotein (pyridoxamine 5'-phosphate oxidase superfamily)